MIKYNHKKIESKWQKKWEKEKLYQAKDFDRRPKFYCLDMFPYPSAQGLHVGHPEGYTATDIISRYLIMKGYNVIHPMGWDAFGLPAENYAIKTGVQPAIQTEKNIKNMKRQIKSLGFAYDWSREINTTDPKYYKWTQWIFLQLFKQGLAYEAVVPINWCPSCKTGLANEEVVGGKCERCGTETVKKDMKQWMLKITAYADRLLEDLDDLDWEGRIKEMQKNWIGRSEGAEVEFRIKNYELGIKVFTTRPDTLFGCTYMIVAPEHSIIENLKSKILNYSEVSKYLDETRKKSDLERTDLVKAKTGVELKGIKAINPVNGKEIPVWVADYVLVSYGTGAIMAVPAHDQRDYDFALKYSLPIVEVIQSTSEQNQKSTANAGQAKIKNQNDKLKIKNCLIIHGSPRYDQSKEPGYVSHNIKHWFGWLKEKLEEQGIKTYNPQMPVPWQPKYEEWKKELENLDIGENSVLVGHSAGGTFLVRWLGEKKIKVKKLILVAPAKILHEGEERMKDFYNFLINPEIKNLAEEIIIFISNDEERRIKSAKLYQKELGAKLIELENRGHFVTKDMGTREFPELLEEILSSNHPLSPIAYTGEGTLINSEQFNGMASEKAKWEITDWLAKKGLARKTVNYKLRDWVFSRQRYWGEPIPLVFCEQCKNRKYNFIILHGFESDSKSGFKPWLKEQLEKGGHKVYSPDLPNTYQPSIDEQAQHVLNNIKIDENTILVGHSLGGVVALKILEKIKNKIFKTLFVDSFIRPEFNDKRRPEVEKSCDWNFNFKKIKKASLEFVILGDKNYPIIPKEQIEEMGKLFSASVILVNPQKNHFSGSKEEPEILKQLEPSGWIAISEKNLPLQLPKVKEYKPTGTGESPLAGITKWVNVKCSKCKGPAKRETNTMPQWAGSSWYWLRFIDPKNNKKLADEKKLKYWLPIDLYVGGAEHAVLHLLYARFWNKFLCDIDAVPKVKLPNGKLSDEPFYKLRNQGIILGEDGEKMSKSRGNVINPDDVVDQYGADTLRMYEMFMGPFADAKPWSTKNIMGVRRFVERVWGLNTRIIRESIANKNTNSDLERLLHKTIKKVAEDIENFRFNTAISAMMIFVNKIYEIQYLPITAYQLLLTLLSPFAPHLAEELWQQLNSVGVKRRKQRRVSASIFQEKWPEYDPKLIKDEEIEIAVQINGKVRDELMIGADLSEEEIKKIVLEREKVKQWLGGKEPKKVIYVKGKLVSVVV